MSELFKSIELNPKYEASTWGNIRRKGSIKNLKFTITKKGYYITHLGRGITIKVHRIIANTFLENKSHINLQVNHKDGNKLNNHINNLEYCTQSENFKHFHKYKLCIPFYFLKTKEEQCQLLLQNLNN